MTMTKTLTEADLKGIYDFAKGLGARAGEMLVEGMEQRMGGGERDEQVEKMNSVDIVTKTDKDVERYIMDSIAKKYPSHKFIGEETYSGSGSKEYLIDDEPTWCVDPLDGTVNYTHLFPMFCVSIAFIYKSVPTIGVIVAPMLNKSYHALKGHGAYITDTHTSKSTQLPFIRSPVPPMPEKAPKGCTFSCEWGKDRRYTTEGNLWRKTESFINMAGEIGGRGGKGGMVHGVRSLGSATLDLAYVATGAFDIWWEGGCWEWDVAAGICILQEAGGLVTTANPPANVETGPIEDVRLGSRLYLAIRPAGDGNGETGRQAQERVVREVWKRVEKINYERPGA